MSGRWRKDAEQPDSTRADRLPARYDLSLPGNQRKLDVADELALLDRIDELVPPGTNLNADDAGWQEPALQPAARRVTTGAARP